MITLVPLTQVWYEYEYLPYMNMNMIMYMNMNMIMNMNMNMNMNIWIYCRPGPVVCGDARLWHCRALPDEKRRLLQAQEISGGEGRGCVCRVSTPGKRCWGKRRLPLETFWRFRIRSGKIWKISVTAYRTRHLQYVGLKWLIVFWTTIILFLCICQLFNEKRRLPVETLWGFRIRSGEILWKFRIWHHVRLDINNI